MFPAPAVFFPEMSTQAKWRGSGRDRRDGLLSSSQRQITSCGSSFTVIKTITLFHVLPRIISNAKMQCNSAFISNSHSYLTNYFKVFIPLKNFTDKSLGIFFLFSVISLC